MSQIFEAQPLFYCKIYYKVRFCFQNIVLIEIPGVSFQLANIQRGLPFSHWYPGSGVVLVYIDS